MLVLKDVSKSYLDKQILNKVTLSLKEHEVVGLIGENGSGKSTLFKIIVGIEDKDSGFVQSDEAIAYLPQYPNPKGSVKEFLLTKTTEARPYKINLALASLGLSQIDLDQPCDSLSGGEKTRLYLASFFVSDNQPTTLLLDEPTNNLDIASLNWLEKFIGDFKGSVFLTSHDRYFLDKTVNRILELKDGRIKEYGGNYSFYKEQKRIEQQAYERQYKSQQKRIKQINEDIVATKDWALKGEKLFKSSSPYEKKKTAKEARTAKVRERKLEKLLEGENYLEKPQARKSYDFGFSGESPTGKLMLAVENVNKSFGNKKILSNISFSIRGSERVWLCGPNGSGKTTLIKIINGELNTDAGKITFGTGVKVGYFSQEHTSLSPNSTGLEELKAIHSDLTDIYTFSAYLHLAKADLKKRISGLSMGQTTKLAFVKLLLENNDLLILDEPTNYLEIETREEIEDALKDYKGAILVSSHDRYFVERLEVDRLMTPLELYC